LRLGAWGLGLGAWGLGLEAWGLGLGAWGLGLEAWGLGLASDEFTEAIRWYEGKRTGLGGEFYDAVVRATDLIREHPAIGQSVELPPRYRQLVVDRFPFKVIYRERADDIYIVAIAHSSRRPGYWRNRR